MLFFDPSAISAGFRTLELGQGKSKPVPGLPAQARYDYQGEITAIGQWAEPFHSPYRGRNSYPSNGVSAATETATLYMGIRPLPNVEFYVNPEAALGSAPGAGLGLAGYTNGDLIGQDTYPNVAYFARAFVRWRIPVRQGKDQPVGRENVGRAPNVIAGPVPQHRFVVTVGKFSITDFFDYNSYADNARTQFINNAFVNNLAYDYAEDARGYDYGATVVLVNPTYAVRVGTFAMPTSAGSESVAYNLANSHSEQVELELDPQVLKAPKPPLTLRFLAYENTGTMGRYSDALAAAPLGSPPSLAGVRHTGVVRTGLGLNAEQGLADGGATGLFARLGFADGGIESDGYAEADEAASAGVQISGAHWKRKNDLLGFALGADGISSSHRQYLQGGGLGLTLGDGTLRYGPEVDAEGYYLYQISKSWQATADVQWIQNPGYNEDRGPVPVLSLRAHYVF